MVGFSEQGGGRRTPWEENGYADADTYAKSMEIRMQARKREIDAAYVRDPDRRAAMLAEAQSLRAEAEGLKRLQQPVTTMAERYEQRRGELRPSMSMAERYEQRREAAEGSREIEDNGPAAPTPWSEMGAVQRVSEAMKNTDREVGKAMVAALREMTDKKNIVVDNIKSFWSDVRKGYAAIREERQPTLRPAPRMPEMRREPQAFVRGPAPQPEFLQGPSPSERTPQVKDIAA